MKTIYISQPGLSKVIKRLEKELGKDLFIRSNRKITLTDDGILLRKRAQEIIDIDHYDKLYFIFLILVQNTKIFRTSRKIL